MGKWHEFLCTLVKDPRARRSVAWEDLVRALQYHGFNIKFTTEGALFFHQDHPTKKIISVAKPHSGRQSSVYVRVAYINNVCNFLKELESFEWEV